MSITLIELLGNTVSVVSLPASPSFQSLDWSANTSVAVVTSVFTGQVQTQQWPGSEVRSGTATLPPMTSAQAKPWKAALLQLQGMSNAFQLGDPLGATPQGHVQGAPVADSSVPMVAGGQTLYAAGWTSSQINLLLPGDYVQVGYRLYTVLDTVISDGSGKAAINVWPSLREVPTGQIVTNSALGLFRLAKNSITWSEDGPGGKLTHLSFGFMEYR